MIRVLVVDHHSDHGELASQPEYSGLPGVITLAGMYSFIILLIHVIVTRVRLAGPGDFVPWFCSMVARSARICHRLLILNRERKRAPNPRATDRFAADLLAPICSPRFAQL
jgi:hypothetical protein